MTDTAATVVFDPYDHGTQDDPFPTFTVMREHCPVYHDPDDRFWALSRYDDVRAALHDHESFSNDGGIILGADISMAPPSMVLMDPPRHTQLRTLVSRAFTARRVAAYEQALRGAVTEFIAEMRDADVVDLVPQFAQRVPIRAISDIVGVPPADRGQFREWADIMLTDPTSPEGMAGMMECILYFQKALDDRRNEPVDDFMSGLVQVEVDGERLSVEEQLGMILLLFLAGIETTQFHFSNACWELGLHPDLQRRLREDPSLVPAATEEILRYDAPVQGDIRTLKRDVELHGVTMPEGATVFVLFGSANRDPSVFADPDVLDVTREPNPHLTFAQGPHFCLGAPLVRLESRVAFEELFRQLPPYELDVEHARRRYTNGPFMRGMESVPVRFG